MNGYIKKTKPALWRSLPSVRRQERAQAKRLDERKRTQPAANQTPRKHIRKQTTKLARDRAQYRKEVKAWLAEGHQYCTAHLVTTGRLVKAIQCHHRFGRRGKLLLWKPGWLPVSQEGHDWINSHPKEAQELKLIGPKGTWNDFKRAQACVAKEDETPF